MGEFNQDRIKRHERMLETISKGRTPLAVHLLEDEAIRIGAEQTARKFVIQCEKEKNDMPVWMWHLLFFTLGVLFCLSIPGFSNLLWNFIKANGSI